MRKGCSHGPTDVSVLIKTLIQPHLTPVVGCLLVSHMSYKMFQPPQVSRLRRWRWCVLSCLLLAVPRLLWCLALRLPRGAVFLDEGPVNRWPDDLAGGNRHSVELTEARNQSGNPCNLINNVRYELSNMHTHLCQDGINELTLH